LLASTCCSPPFPTGHTHMHIRPIHNRFQHHQHHQHHHHHHHHHHHQYTQQPLTRRHCGDSVLCRTLCATTACTCSWICFTVTTACTWSVCMCLLNRAACLAVRVGLQEVFGVSAPAPRVAVLSNVTAGPLSGPAATCRASMSTQLFVRRGPSVERCLDTPAGAQVRVCGSCPAMCHHDVCL
jgi:hypothetical protein